MGLVPGTSAGRSRDRQEGTSEVMTKVKQRTAQAIMQDNSISISYNWQTAGN